MNQTTLLGTNSHWFLCSCLMGPGGSCSQFCSIETAPFRFCSGGLGSCFWFLHSCLMGPAGSFSQPCSIGANLSGRTLARALVMWAYRRYTALAYIGSGCPTESLTCVFLPSVSPDSMQASYSGAAGGDFAWDLKDPPSRHLHLGSC